VWSGQQATSRGAMWEGRGSLVYRPSCLTENAAGACVGRTTRHEHVCPRSEGVQRTTRRTVHSAFRLEELNVLRKLARSVPRVWGGVALLGATHALFTGQERGCSRTLGLRCCTRWWHGLSVLWGTVGCHSRSTTNSFESTVMQMRRPAGFLQSALVVLLVHGVAFDATEDGVSRVAVNSAGDHQARQTSAPLSSTWPYPGEELNLKVACSTRYLALQCVQQPPSLLTSSAWIRAQLGRCRRRVRCSSSLTLLIAWTDTIPLTAGVPRQACFQWHRQCAAVLRRCAAERRRFL
jgi:hypothetical protein